MIGVQKLPQTFCYTFFFKFFSITFRFLQLSSVLDPDRPPRSDKASILSDAARLLVQLKTEAEQLKESNEKLQETIKELKV